MAMQAGQVGKANCTKTTRPRSAASDEGGALSHRESAESSGGVRPRKERTRGSLVRRGAVAAAGVREVPEAPGVPDVPSAR
jgi:hypothetical protein